MPNSSKALVLAGALAAALTGCGGGGETPQAARESIPDPLVISYDGGLYVLDGNSLQVKADLPLDGFLRVNPAGDDAHVLVSAGEGFRLLDASAGELTDTTFKADEPGHVVAHGEHTVLFADGSGEITVLNPHDLGASAPRMRGMKAPEPHHGVAVVLDDGSWVRSEGNPDERSGAVAFDASDREIARNDECPGLHGETVVDTDTLVFGCENGVLTFVDGAFAKIAAPDEYGRIGTVRGHQDSPVALGDYKVDPDAELERPDRFALVDTVTDQLRLVPLPQSVSYSFRSLARGPHAEGLILATDGNLHVVDPASGQTIKAIAVTEPWTEPDDWQQPRPSVFARGHDVYVTDPATKQVHAVDIESGDVTASATLDQVPNELSGTVGHEH
ncbi:zinc metallochaperone AztD [Mycolicibacterium sp. 050232]|uniref:zinc metallochaperone AztD n=1 Tax=Mycolicibacterium sp. 050232 TaxID=3113982 RepID=UPI002E29772C|nr:zinc metallochaperone AztD [Mycolicibacterium sp. 050232]MED5814115.1 zinc metallochaperone AztD [Mycolicibacterium sp. 050232]